MRVSLAHISTGCNRVVNALSWSEDGLVAFAAHNTVVVYDVEVRSFCRQPPCPFGTSTMRMRLMLGIVWLWTN